MSGAIQLITFDFLGTLAHFKGSPIDHYSDVLQNMGISFQRDSLARGFQQALGEASKQRANFGYSQTTSQQWWEGVVTSTVKYASDVDNKKISLSRRDNKKLATSLYERFSGDQAYSLFPDVKEALEVLKEDRRPIKLGIISNTDERLFKILESLKIGTFFDIVVTSKQFGFEKPHPNIFHIPLTTFGVRPEGAVHVGDDKVKDFDGAANAGLWSVLVNRMATPSSKVISSLTQLPSWLTNLEKNSDAFFSY